MIAIVDYGVGNLFSLSCSFEVIGAQAVVSSDARLIEQAERVVLPGVGAFRDAAHKLSRSGLGDLLTELAARGKPILGICLGMQLLFEKSLEYGEHAGLGLIRGSIAPIADQIPRDYKVPHMGWNALKLRRREHPLLKYVREGEYVYFVHSFSAIDCEESILATAQYGAELTAAVAQGNVMGCQFHPEKSGDVGLRILKAFCEAGGEHR